MEWSNIDTEMIADCITAGAGSYGFLYFRHMAEAERDAPGQSAEQTERRVSAAINVLFCGGLGSPEQTGCQPQEWREFGEFMELDFAKVQWTEIGQWLLKLVEDDQSEDQKRWQDFMRS